MNLWHWCELAILGLLVVHAIILWCRLVRLAKFTRRIHARLDRHLKAKGGSQYNLTDNTKKDIAIMRAEIASRRSEAKDTDA